MREQCAFLLRYENTASGWLQDPQWVAAGVDFVLWCPPPPFVSHLNKKTSVVHRLGCSSWRPLLSGIISEANKHIHWHVSMFRKCVCVGGNNWPSVLLPWITSFPEGLLTRKCIYVNYFLKMFLHRREYWSCMLCDRSFLRWSSPSILLWRQIGVSAAQSCRMFMVSVSNTALWAKFSNIFRCVIPKDAERNWKSLGVMCLYASFGPDP